MRFFVLKTRTEFSPMTVPFTLQWLRVRPARSAISDSRAIRIPQIHLRMFEVAAQHGFHFNTVQMPVNAMDAHFRSFTREVIPVAQKAGTGILGMKTFGDGYILRSGTIDATEALHYGLFQPVSVLITGIDKPEILTQALTAASTFKPFSQEQTATFLAKTKDAAISGKSQPFKTSSIFDGTANNPKWLGGTSRNEREAVVPGYREQTRGLIIPRLVKREAWLVGRTPTTGV